MEIAGVEACISVAMAIRNVFCPDWGSWESFPAERRIVLSPEDTMYITEDVKRQVRRLEKDILPSLTHAQIGDSSWEMDGCRMLCTTGSAGVFTILDKFSGKLSNCFGQYKYILKPVASTLKMCYRYPYYQHQIFIIFPQIVLPLGPSS